MGFEKQSSWVQKTKSSEVEEFREAEMKRKLGRRFVVSVYVVMTLVLCAASPAGETYKQDGQGLAKEFEPFLRAYHKGDDKGMDETFGAFRIPNAKEWFAAHFSVEDAERLNAAYGRQVLDAQNSLIEDMNQAGAGNKYSVHCEARGDVAAGTGKAGGDGVLPVKAMRVEQFVMEFQAGGTRSKFLFMANFVYVDGAYRFVGGGGGPFWVKM